MLRIRPMTSGDLDAGLRLCRLSNWNQLADDWLCFLDNPAGAGWLAQQDGEPVGSVAVLRYRPSFAWLSMMLVHPDHRRAGIGSRLMEAALEALGDETCVRLDATPAGEPLYRRFGFIDEYPLARAVAAAPAWPDSPGAVRAMTPSDLPGICGRDREVFGADRSALLASLYRRAPALAAIGPGDSYCFGRPGYRYAQIGPLVANGVESAAALVLRCRPEGPVSMDVPRHSPAWIGWLESAGFVVERPFLRMRRGTNLDPGEPHRQFAIAGPEFG